MKESRILPHAPILSRPLDNFRCKKFDLISKRSADDTLKDCLRLGGSSSCEEQINNRTILPPQSPDEQDNKTFRRRTHFRKDSSSGAPKENVLQLYNYSVSDTLPRPSLHLTRESLSRRPPANRSSSCNGGYQSYRETSYAPQPMRLLSKDKLTHHIEKLHSLQTEKDQTLSLSAIRQFESIKDNEHDFGRNRKKFRLQGEPVERRGDSLRKNKYLRRRESQKRDVDDSNKENILVTYENKMQGLITDICRELRKMPEIEGECSLKSLVGFLKDYHQNVHNLSGPLC